jgi:hypothetical protein
MAPRSVQSTQIFEKKSRVHGRHTYDGLPRPPAPADKMVAFRSAKVCSPTVLSRSESRPSPPEAIGFDLPLNQRSMARTEPSLWRRRVERQQEQVGRSELKRRDDRWVQLLPNKLRAAFNWLAAFNWHRGFYRQRPGMIRHGGLQPICPFPTAGCPSPRRGKTGNGEADQH